MPVPDWLVREIQKVLVQQDIEQLTVSGSSNDVYEREARELAFRLKAYGEQPKSQLLEWLEQIWSKNFELSPKALAQRKTQLEAVASSIIGAVYTRGLITHA